MNSRTFQLAETLWLRYAVLSLSVILILLLGPGCSFRGRNDPSRRPEITVAAAANLSDAFDEMGREFAKQSGIQPVFNYGATAELARQIENGAPFDLFAAADVQHIDDLVKKGLIVPTSKAIYGRGRLVLWAPPSFNGELRGLTSLDDPSIGRIAVAKPDVAPYGKATVEALKNLNLWPKVEPKVIFGQSVSQTRQFAATGNAEVAFLPLSLVKFGEGRYIEVPEGLHEPIDQAVGVIAASTHANEALEFQRFLLSEKGRAILMKYGYALP